MRALDRARTVVCEPVLRVRLEIPADTVGAVLAALPGFGAAVHSPSLREELAVVEATMPAARVPHLHRRLSGLTGGEGVLESSFAGYRPVVGDPPSRPRTTPDPLNREEYLAQLSRPGAVGGP